MTHYAHTTPKARKPHQCQMCCRTIDPGETYRRGVGMDGSTAWTWIECAHCVEFIRVAYYRVDDGDGNTDDMLGYFEPRDIPEARIFAQWKRRWRRLDGSLYPLPVVTITEDKYGFGRPTTIAPGVSAWRR